MDLSRPYTLIAELTYRCPLRCGYCSNPVGRPDAERGTEDWRRAIDEAAALGVVQLHLTGGEPLLRDDLAALVAAGRRAGMYVNLITSGVPLDEARLGALAAAGLDHVQLSVQDVGEEAADRVAGMRGAWAQKRRVAGWVRAAGMALTINVVLHRGNIDRVGGIIALARALGADRVELACVQVLGSALVNRAALLPSRAQVDDARRAAASDVGIEIAFVLPDYHAGRPRACMDGWGRRYLLIAPDGLVLPCHAARGLPLAFDALGARPLAEIWRASPGFVHFRGEAWMPEPCRSCARRADDFGGCRCQAFHLTGDAAATDPACALSPHHDLVRAALEDAPPPLVAISRRRG
jgi:pyrroloquinoline quinone biosynthesis protein E